MSFDRGLFLSVFSLIFFAELPDKTLFATFLLASRSNPWATFIGVAGAFLIQSIVAVLFGSLFKLLPESIVQGAAALLFFIFAWQSWRQKPEADSKDLDDKLPHQAGRALFFKEIASSFTVIFIAEWGDLTQLATATIAARSESKLTVFLAATSALWTVTALAIWVGSRAKGWIRPELLQKIAAIAFFIVGCVMTYRLLSR